MIFFTSLIYQRYYRVQVKLAQTRHSNKTLEQYQSINWDASSQTRNLKVCNLFTIQSTT